jgi:hypothetical protein
MSMKSFWSALRYGGKLHASDVPALPADNQSQARKPWALEEVAILDKSDPPVPDRATGITQPGANDLVGKSRINSRSGVDEAVLPWCATR